MKKTLFLIIIFALISGQAFAGKTIRNAPGGKRTSAQLQGTMAFPLDTGAADYYTDLAEHYLWIKAQTDLLYQPLDADLTYLAGVTLSNDLKTFLNTASAALARTALGLGSASDVTFNSLTLGPSQVIKLAGPTVAQGGHGTYTALQSGDYAGAEGSVLSWRLPITAYPSAGTTSLLNVDEYGQMGQVAPSTFAAASHNHAGSAITSGTVAAAYLPAVSGSTAGIVPTTNSVTDGWLLTKQSDGSSAWAAPPSGSAHDAVTLSTDLGTNLLGLSTQQLTLDNQTANYVFAGPTTGSAAAPSFRALVAGDIPSLTSTYQSVDATLTALAGLTITEGSLIYGTGADAFAVLAKGAGGKILAMNSGATAPEWVTPFNPAAPGAIGGTTPAAGTFTTLTFTTLLSDATDGNHYANVENSASHHTSPSPASGDFDTVGGIMYVYRDSAWNRVWDSGSVMGTGLVFEGATADDYETTLAITDPTADRTITFPNATGTVALTSDIPSVPSAAAASDINTGTDTSKFVTADALAGSDLGAQHVNWIIKQSDVVTAVADGKDAFVVPAAMNGMNLTDLTCSVSDLNSASGGSTDVVVRRVRGATAADMTSTACTISYDAYTASDETVDTSNDDLATGDKIFVDVNAVTTGAAQKGLSCVATFAKP